MLQLLLEFEFVRRTMLVGLLLSIAIPMLGIVMVSRRTSMMADALSHTSLAGVALGLIAGFSPVLGAVIVAVVGAFVIELLRRRFPQYGDLATAVTLSAGLGTAVILADLAPTGRSFESYLFGSITAVTAGDVWATALAFVLVMLASIVFYGSQLDMVVDVELARISGQPVALVNAVFTGLAAIVVALAAKVIGALLVVSLMVLPVAAALIVARSYKSAYRLAVALGVAYTMVGMTLSYEFDVRPGGAIVVVAVLGLLLLAGYRGVVKAGSERTRAA
ncbi:metal ABC transporter permease [Staphylococcus chromogenes]|nr:metal ABC transporter permease [Staphylococcus chromogenes]